jgi:multiple sugar transport system ATP-binding protein
MVFQSYALYPHMTAGGNIGFSLKIRGVPRNRISDVVGESSRMLGLEAFLGRLPAELSGGQRQRVAMGRALVRTPQVFLFDEPLSNLDAKLRVQMRTEIRSLHQRLSATSVYVTHDQIEAMTMADRVVVLNAGKVEQVGPPLEIYDQPANLFVATFMGSPQMTVFTGVVRRSPSAIYLSGGNGLEFPLPDSAAPFLDREISVGIRPEHFEIVGDSTSGIEARVTVVEPIGYETLVFADAWGQSACARAFSRTRLKPGDKIRLSPSAGRAHFFDGQTRHRLTEIH